MRSEEFERLLAMVKAMAHESRLKILGILASRECSVDELATRLDLRAPTISHHLSALRSARLVRMRSEGTHHLYRLDAKGLLELRKSLRTPAEVARLVGDESLDAWDRKILSHFVKGEKLLEIPASRKKRQAILRWLVGKFEPGVRYPERKVSQILLRHHWDSATLRRELVASRLMQRTRDGIYWRAASS